MKIKNSFSQSIKIFFYPIWLFTLILADAKEHIIPNTMENEQLDITSLYKISNDNRLWTVVRASTPSERTRIAETGMAIEEVQTDLISGIAHEDTVKAIENLGFIIESKTPLEQCLLEKISKSSSYPYPRYSGVTATLQQLAQDNPDIASLFSMGKTIQGREIWTLRLNTTASGLQPSTKPGAVFIGTIHAREHLSTIVSLELAEWLCNNKTDPSVQALLNSRDIYIAPLVNPDGSEYDFTGNPFRCYRKNMRTNNNKNMGVDLNRNFGYLWGGIGSSSVTGSEVYRGPYAFSELESQALKRFFERRNNIKTFISYHTFGELILYPWGAKLNPIENELDRRVHIMYAQKMAEITGYRPLQASKFYLDAGDATDWAYAARGVISFTFELAPKSGIGCSGFYPNNQALIDHTVAVNIQAALYLLQVTDNPYKSIPLFDELLDEEIGIA